MKRWILSAVLILAAVTAGYSIYESTQPAEASPGHHSKESSSGHSGHDPEESERSVSAKAAYKDGTISIHVKDDENQPYSRLQVNHEKIMHLIVVSEDLKTYRHLHPDKREDGLYEVRQSLPDGRYKAFVDIKPEDAAYEIQPANLSAGAAGPSVQSTLYPDDSFVQRSSEYEAKMSPEQLKANEAVRLSFTFNKGTPERYLGAAGHVVILDEKGEKFLHVHPLSDNETKFETTFKDPGVYKIWAEFKFEGKVHVFPYSVKVED
ncbi:hypothetical protein GKZ89_00810 [Bacillus mangrovi]|uniref:Secreted protein n=1 Tax=Metabacillus mangrovi TaxID=1491830 RepID=A0A7X2V3B6_9BACI|nr:hypothetical protein [Metabacillus mangrovi]MTH51929.1 hypothetical protein [Metabacillus mangrovi]